MSRFIPSILTGASRADEAQDCTVRALANALDTNYDEAHAALRKHGRKHGKPCGHKVWHRAYSEAGLSLMNIYGTTAAARHLSRSLQQKATKGTTLGTLLKSIGCGRFVVIVTGHAICVLDGQVIDKYSNLSNKSVVAVYSKG